jgi:hypothetical protein
MNADRLSGGHYGGQQNSMVNKGSVEVGCGKYSYSLEGPPRSPASGPASVPTGITSPGTGTSAQLRGKQYIFFSLLALWCYFFQQ